MSLPTNENQALVAQYLKHKIKFFFQTQQPSLWCCCFPPVVKRPPVKWTPRKLVEHIPVACTYPCGTYPGGTDPGGTDPSATSASATDADDS